MPEKALAIYKLAGGFCMDHHACARMPGALRSMVLARSGMESHDQVRRRIDECAVAGLDYRVCQQAL